MMENATRYELFLQDRYFQRALGNTIGTTLGAVMGVIGNSLVILVYFHRIKDTGERYFIPLLAVVDLLACLTGPAFYIMDNTYFYNYPSSVYCRIFSFFHLCLSAISGYVLLFISLQRYLLVCKPFGPKMTLFWKRTAFVSSCGFGFLCCVPLLGIAGIVESKEIYRNHTITTRICKYSMYESPFVAAYFAVLLILSFASIVVTTVLYIPVLQRIRRSILKKPFAVKKKKLASQTNNHKAPSVVNKKDNDSLLSYKETKFAGRDMEDVNRKSTLIPPAYPESEKESEISIVRGEYQKDKKDNTCSRSKTRFNSMFFFLILTYILSYIPPLLILVLAYTIKDFNYLNFHEAQTLAWIYLPRLVFINHIVNPFIYSYFDSKFKDQLTAIFLEVKRKFLVNDKCK